MVVVVPARSRWESVVRAVPLRGLVVAEQMVAQGQVTVEPHQPEARGMAPVEVVVEASPTEVEVELDTTAAVEAVVVAASEQVVAVGQVIRSAQPPCL